MEFLDGWFAVVAFFALAHGGSGGEAAESGGYIRTDLADVIEGENPVERREGDEIVFEIWKRADGRGAGIEDCAEHAGGGGFSAEGRAFKNQDGVWALRTEGGQEPDGCTVTVGVREVEQSLERGHDLPGYGLGIGVRQFAVASVVEEESGGVGGELPTLRSDFDDFAFGVGEVQEDAVGMVRIAFRGDAALDRAAGSTRVGAGGESADGLAERVGAWWLVMIAIEGGDEPVANAGRVDGADLLAEGVEREAEEGLAGGGHERGGVGGVVEEDFDVRVHVDLVIADGIWV